MCFIDELAELQNSYSCNKIINQKKMLKLSPKKYRIELKNQSYLRRYIKPGKDAELVRLAKQILKQGKFMYIDINQQEGYKLMNECESSDDDQQIDKISNKYVVNLNDLNSPTLKNINYIYKMQQEYKKRKRTLSMLKDSLEKSSEKMKEMIRPGPSSTRYKFLANRTISLNKQANYKHSPIPIESQFSKKLNSRLYHSFHKNLESTFNSSTIHTERSLRENRKQSDDIYMSAKRLKMLLPSISKNKKKLGL